MLHIPRSWFIGTLTQILCTLINSAALVPVIQQLRNLHQKSFGIIIVRIESNTVLLCDQN